MGALKEWLRRRAEKLLGRWAEGPEPPDRVAEMVVVFANEHPRATVAEWIAFATGHAQEFYRSAYKRGREWAEREDWRDPAVDPEVIADQLDPYWRWRPGVRYEGDGMRIVPWEELPPDEELERHFAEYQRLRGGGRDEEQR